MTTTGAQVADATGEGCMQASAISESECWSLLASAPMGRLSAWVGDWPSIIPVQFYLDDGSIAVCLGPHTLDARSLDGAKVGFAVDGVESSSTSWWTVQVHGLGRTIPPIHPIHGGTVVSRMAGECSSLTNQPSPGPAW